MADLILEAKSVSKSYPVQAGALRSTVGMVQAVDQVSCALAGGETLGLVGESGSGKTTLAKLLIGLLSPTAGEVLIQGQSFTQLKGTALLAARRRVQFVFQNPMNSLNPRMTVEETLSEPLIIHRIVSSPQRRRRVRRLLSLVQLPSGCASRLPRELSGGERQRVGIARALATEPKALICDEPIASLDVSVGAKILQLLRSLCEARRMALLFISHDLRAVAFLCERIAVMRDGRLIEAGPTRDLLTRPKHSYTELLIRSAELDLSAPTV